MTSTGRGAPSRVFTTSRVRSRTASAAACTSEPNRTATSMRTDTARVPAATTSTATGRVPGSDVTARLTASTTTLVSTCTTPARSSRTVSGRPGRLAVRSRVRTRSATSPQPGSGASRSARVARASASEPGTGAGTEAGSRGPVAPRSLIVVPRSPRHASPASPVASSRLPCLTPPCQGRHVTRLHVTRTYVTVAMPPSSPPAPPGRARAVPAPRPGRRPAPRRPPPG